MSAWIGIRGYLLNFVVPIAISILKQILTNLKPEAIAKFTTFLQGIYDKAVVDGDKVIQSIIVSIVAPLFGIEIVLAVASPTVLSPAEITLQGEVMMKTAVESYVSKEPAYTPPPVDTP